MFWIGNQFWDHNVPLNYMPSPTGALAGNLSLHRAWFGINGASPLNINQPTGDK